MDKFLKEKLINTTFEGLDKKIESEHKNHKSKRKYINWIDMYKREE